MKHLYATVNGVKLHFVADGSGPLMLFVHGFPEFWYAWKDQLQEFSRDHHAVALDMRGFNLSDKPLGIEPYRPKHLVEDLCQFIDHLGGRPCIIVAHDWGGGAAWNLAAQRPEYVSRLIIINSPHPVPFVRALKDDPEQIAASQYMVTLRDSKSEEIMSENNFARMEKMLRGDTNTSSRWPTTEDMARYREAWSQPGALTASLNYYRASPLHPASPSSPGATALELDPRAFTVTVPTLVIWGERDPALLPVLLSGLDEVVLNLTIKRIPNGSHWVAHEYPDEVNRAIRNFIDTPH